MIWGKALAYSAAVAWSAILVLWPVSIDRPSPHAEISEKAGEGLYKATLTGAGLGLSDIEFFETRDGKKQWNIRSKFAELHRKENYAYLQVVDADFYADKTGNVVNTKSDYGRSELEKHVVDLEGNVSIRATKGYLFEMDKLNYHSRTHAFTTDEKVRMRGPDVKKPQMFLTGTGLHANIDDEHFFLRKNVSGQKKLKSSEWMKIHSRNGEFFTNEQRAIFNGKVKAALPAINIDSDTLEISTAQEKEFLYAKGNVVLKNRDRVGRSETAMIEIGTNKIVLEGRARIDSQSNQITGKRILLYTDDDRIEVEEAEGRLGQ